jgi:hypothetical protein
MNPNFQPSDGLLFRVAYLNELFPGQRAGILYQNVLERVASNMPRPEGMTSIENNKYEAAAWCKERMPQSMAKNNVKWINEIMEIPLNAKALYAFEEKILKAGDKDNFAKQWGADPTYRGYTYEHFAKPAMESNLVPSQELLDRLYYASKRGNNTSKVLFEAILVRAAVAMLNTEQDAPVLFNELMAPQNQPAGKNRLEPYKKLILDNCELRVKNLNDISPEAESKNILKQAISEIQSVGRDMIKAGHREKGQAAAQLGEDVQALAKEFFAQPMITQKEVKAFDDVVNTHVSIAKKIIDVDERP